MITVLWLAPIVFWLNMLPLKFRLGGMFNILTCLGQLTGLVGMALFSISLILSARLKFFDRFLNGLNRVYINHHRLGATAFVLLMLHPLFLSARYITTSVVLAANFWLPGSNWAINFGLASLFGMMALLILTFFISLRYNIWKNTHKYLGAAFFLGGLHSFLISSDISRNPPLRYYMLILAGAGIAAYIYQTLLGKWTIKRYLYTVEEIKNLNNTVVEITLSPFEAQKIFSYAPGQYAFINFQDKNISAEQHPFSFASIPQDKNLKFVIKNLGDYTADLKKLTKSAKAKVEGPYGKFSFLNTANKNQIWVAGGIGVTPFLSMGMYLKNLPADSGYAIDLYYCVRNEAEMVLFEELKSINTVRPNFRIISFCSEKQGYINAKTIADTSNGLMNKEIFLCGPPAMMRNLRTQLKDLGVGNRQIHSEEFGF